MIFRLCLRSKHFFLEPNGRPRKRRRDYSPSYCGTERLQPALLRANKQIHDEASAVLYGDNTFLFILGIFHRYVAEHEEDSSLGNTRNPAPAIQDNLTRLSPREMKKIRECVLVIRLPPKVGWAGSARSRYVELCCVWRIRQKLPKEPLPKFAIMVTPAVRRLSMYNLRP